MSNATPQTIVTTPHLRSKRETAQKKNRPRPPTQTSAIVLTMMGGEDEGGTAIECNVGVGIVGVVYGSSFFAWGNRKKKIS